MGVFRIAAQHLRQRREVLSAHADHHAISIRTGSDGDLCQPACRDTGRFLETIASLPGFGMAPEGHFLYSSSLARNEVSVNWCLRVSSSDQECKVHETIMGVLTL